MKRFVLLLMCIAVMLSFTGCITQTDLDAAREEGYDEGYAEGYEIGFEEGEQESFESAVDMGYGAGYADGYTDGEAAASATTSYSTTPRTDYSPSYSTTSDDMVYIPRTGSKYHNNSSCSGMKNPSYVSLDDAIAWGYTACKNCY